MILYPLCMHLLALDYTTIPSLLFCFALTGKRIGTRDCTSMYLSIPPKTSGLPGPDQITSLLYKELIRSELKESTES